MLWEAVPTALVAAFSPWILLIIAGLLSLERPLPLALMFLGTAALITLAVGFTVVEVLSGTGVDDSRKHRTVPPAIDVALGVAILVFAAVVARRPPPKAKTERRELGLLAVIALGAVAASPSPLYLTSLHSIAKGHPDGVAIVVDVVVIAALVLLFAEIPLVMFVVAPERTAAVLKASNDWLARHGRTIVVTVATLAGCYFVIRGLLSL